MRRSIPYPASSGYLDNLPASTPPRRGFKAATGFLLRPAANTPRRTVSLAAAYDGLPSRAGLTMPEPPTAPRGKAAFGRPIGYRYGLIGRPEAAGRSGPGIPPVGNVTPSPVVYPPAVGGLSFRGRPQTTSAQMRQPQRLTRLLPNPMNLWEPARYGED